MRVSTTQVLQEQVREIPVRHKLDIVHPASKQGRLRCSQTACLFWQGSTMKPDVPLTRLLRIAPEAVLE